MPMLAAAAHLCCVCLWSGFRSPGPSPVYMCVCANVCARGWNAMAGNATSWSARSCNPYNENRVAFDRIEVVHGCRTSRTDFNSFDCSPHQGKRSFLAPFTLPHLSSLTHISATPSRWPSAATTRAHHGDVRPDIYGICHDSQGNAPRRPPRTRVRSELVAHRSLSTCFRRANVRDRVEPWRGWQRDIKNTSARL